MDDVDTLLKEGAERRERASNKRKLLEELRKTTNRSKWTVFPYIVGFGLYLWLFSMDFLSNEPMSKGDAFSLIHYSVMCGWLFYMATSAFRSDRRDLFLIELIEKEIQNEK